MNINYFATENLFDAGRKFFQEELLINLSRVSVNLIPLDKFLAEQLKGNDAALLNEISEAYFLGLVDDESLNDIFNKEANLEDEADKDSSKYQALMVFGIKLKSQDITRTDIAKITRAFNRRVVDKPVVLLIQYGNLLSFSTAERFNFVNAKKQGEKVGKISMLKDIDIESIHAGHRQILWEMKVNPLTVDTFEGLYKQWQKVFSVSLLNENFYNELFNWYLWATKMVKFPKPSHDEIDEESHASISVIRLLTRLIFIWFIKEKKLIRKEIFNKDYISTLLKGFDPNSASDGKYYKAVLQNLFFASLNTEMNKDAPGSRRFLAETKSTTSYSDDYQNQLVYRYKELFKNENEALQLFENIPFLNGGLFECLDYTETIKGKNVENRYDGFSSQPKKQAFVPDVLFFGENPDLDLSGDFENDKKRKHTKVRGIIDILNSYKFTITENTPLEEEIALDPELLGRVFENLLASYNPETKTTARKQTGSFYTPREIVGYMVDESLKTYLLQKLLLQTNSFSEIGKVQTNAFGNEAKKGQTSIQEELIENSENLMLYTEKLDNLFDYFQDANPFDEERTSVLISAISECKILDPACGSGAFPMGILHRMVYLLGKLDPNNKKWKEVQLSKAEKDLKLAKQMTVEEIREKAIESAEMRIEYIKLSFSDNHHELDYTRKLFLIQHCIYGVDIQQIAIQISKLRFFISLIIEQRVDDKKPNRNVLSMPNLETKFIAANSIVVLDKPKVQGMLINPVVEQRERELSDIRQKIFFTRKYKDKKKLKEAEKKKREELKIDLVDSGFGESTATQMASWNPFDPIQSAPFFDTETMFSLTTGFDIVIGNPPYISYYSKQSKQLDSKVEKSFRKNYLFLSNESAKLRINSAMFFLELGMKLLSNNAILCYIVDLNVLENPFLPIRKYFTDEYEIQEIIKDLVAFENVASGQIICRFKKSKSSNNNILFKKGITDGLTKLVGQKTINIKNNYSWTVFENDIISKIENESFHLETIFEVHTGVAVNATETGKEYFIKDTHVKNSYPFLTGGDSVGSSYCSPTWNKFLLHDKKMEQRLNDNFDKFYFKEKGSHQRPFNLRKIEEYNRPKIFLRQSDVKLTCTYVDDLIFGNYSLFNIYNVNNDISKLKYLLALLNSKLLSYYGREKEIILVKPGKTPQIRSGQRGPIGIRQLPIKKIENTKKFVKLVDKILAFKAEDKKTEKYELELDEMVFKLYNLDYEDVKLIVPDFWLNKKEYEAIEI